MSDQTPDSNATQNEDLNQPSIAKPAIITFAVILAIGVSVYGGFKYSQRSSGGMVLPAGTTYLGASPTSTVPLPTTTELKFTTDATVPYKEFIGSIHPFTFSYPETLNLVTFAEDPPRDTIAIVWGNKPPQENILLNIEVIKERDKNLVNKPKIEFVQNWWKNFSGLKDVASVTPFTNVKGMKGYRAQYVNWANTAPNIDIFFEVPSRPDILVHLANGILDATIFNRIVDSFLWLESSPTP